MRKIFYNIVATLVFIVLLLFLYQKLGYKHTFNLLLTDYHLARQVSDEPVERRNLVKLGMGYWMFKYIKDNTPDSAVIYLPGHEAFLADGYGDKFSSVHFSNKLWAVRYLYPRKVVTDREYREFGAHPPLTHVFVVNGYGRDLLDSVQEEPVVGFYGIYPVKQ